MKKSREEELAEAHEELRHNFVVRLAEKQIHPVKRALLVKEEADRWSLSQRAFAKKFGYSHSTIQDWMQYLKFSVQEYDLKLRQGLTKRQIRKILHSKRSYKNKDLIVLEDVDGRIFDFGEFLKAKARMQVFSEKTMELLDDLEKAINTYRFKIKRKQELEGCA